MHPDTWLVDHIEEGIAALAREGEVRRVALDRLPPGIREGDALRISGWSAAGMLPAVHDAAAAARARADAAARLDRLASADPGGDLDL